MGASKSAHFTASQNATAILIKAMAHPARVAIVEHLLKVNACICGDIVNELPLSQPTISQHLRELKLAGMIKGSIEGNAICYCINPEAIEQLKSYFSGISSTLKLNKNNCC